MVTVAIMNFKAISMPILLMIKKYFWNSVGSILITQVMLVSICYYHISLPYAIHIASQNVIFLLMCMPLWRSTSHLLPPVFPSYLNFSFCLTFLVYNDFLHFSIQSSDVQISIWVMKGLFSFTLDNLLFLLYLFFFLEILRNSLSKI